MVDESGLGSKGAFDRLPGRTSGVVGRAGEPVAADETVSETGTRCSGTGSLRSESEIVTSSVSGEQVEWDDASCGQEA